MAVEASLDSLRALIGARSTGDDALLSWALEAASDAIRDNVYADHWNRSRVQEAVLLLAHRLYKRRTSATGTEGFGPEGFAVRVMLTDPDVSMLLKNSWDMTKAGVA